MLDVFILILAVSLDSLSYGIALGFNKIKIRLSRSVIMTIFSTVLFFCALMLSNILINIINSTILYLINGIALILLGLFYFISNITKKEYVENTHDKHFLLSTIIISLDAIFSALLSGYCLKIAIMATIIYCVITFLFIFVANRIAFILPNRLNFNFGILSGLLFIALGILKLLEI